MAGSITERRSSSRPAMMPKLPPGSFASAGSAFGPIRYHRVPPDYDFLHAVTVSIKRPGEAQDINAAGAGLTLRRAQEPALGEALERLSIGNLGARQPVVAAYHGDNPRFVDPRTLLHYLDETYHSPSVTLRPYRDGTEIFWIEGHRIVSGAPLYVPLFAVASGAVKQAPEGGPFEASVSTGAACARDRHVAALSGLYETVERDAFTIHWENRWPGIVETLPQSVLRLEQILSARSFRLNVRRLQTDIGVAVAVAAVVDAAGGRGSLGLGCAARRTWDDAAFRAAEEAVLTSFWVTTMQRLEPTPLEQVMLEMDGLPQPARHAFLYGFPAMLHRAEFLWDSAAETNPCERAVVHDAPETDLGPKAELLWLADRVRSVGVDPLMVEMTCMEAERLGFVVVRVISPGLVPLGRGVRARPLKNPRLHTNPKALGVVPLKAGGYNADPHPFP